MAETGMSGHLEKSTVNLMFRDVAIWAGILGLNVLAVWLLSFPYTKIIVPFWFFVFPFLGIWFFGKRYRNLDPAESLRVGQTCALAGLVIWLSLFGLLVGLYHLTISGSVEAEVPTVDNTATLFLWYTLLPLIFILPLGGHLLRQAEALNRPWYYLCPATAIIVGVVTYAYTLIYHDGKLAVDYVPFVTYVFLIQLLTLYWTSLTKVRLWVSMLALVSVAALAIYFSFEIFFAGFFYHGFAASLIFMISITAISYARSIRRGFRL